MTNYPIGTRLKRIYGGHLQEYEVIDNKDPLYYTMAFYWDGDLQHNGEPYYTKTPGIYDDFEIILPKSRNFTTLYNKLNETT